MISRDFGNRWDEVSRSFHIVCAQLHGPDLQTVVYAVALAASVADQLSILGRARVLILHAAMAAG